MEHQSTLHPLQGISQSFVLQKPRLWTSEHLRLLNVVHLRDVPPVDIVGDAYLPTDDDEELKEVLSHVMKPSREDIWDRKDTARRNHYRTAFTHLSNVMEPPTCDDIPKETRRAAHSFFFALTTWVDAGLVLDDFLGHFKFQYKYGIFHCDGALIFDLRASQRKPPLLPLLTISVEEDSKTSSIANHEIPQMLAQATMAYEKYPSLNSYKTFVLRLRRTIWQLSTATIPRFYMEALQNESPMPTSLEVCSSKELDMVEPSEREEMTRLLIGLIRCLVDREEAG